MDDQASWQHVIDEEIGAWRERAEKAEAEVARLRSLLSSALPEHAPGPFICGRSSAERDRLPDRINVCPSYGADWSAIYQRLD